MVFVTSVLVIFFVFVFRTSYAKIGPVIIEGERALIRDYPHAAFIKFVGKHNNEIVVSTTCGASILHKQILLTAAHCVIDPLEMLTKKHGKIQTLAAVLATVGHTNIKGKEEHSVTHYVAHEKYETCCFANDIALLKLERPLIFGENVKSVKLGKSLPHGKARLPGWGSITENGLKTNDLMQLKGLKVWSLMECKKKFSYVPELVKVTGDQICAGNSNTGGTFYSGDSGGGLIMEENTVVGVVSWSPNNNLQMQVYSSVEYHRQWIKTKTKMLIRGRYKANRFG